MASIFCRLISAFKSDKGQALTELALAAPVLIFAAVAVLSLVQAGQKKAQVTRAAAAAARVAVVRPDLAEHEAIAVLRLEDPRIKASDVKTSVAPAAVAHLPFTNPVRVRVVYKYRALAGFGWHPTFNLKSEFVIDRWVNGVFFDIQ